MNDSIVLGHRANGLCRNAAQPMRAWQGFKRRILRVHIVQMQAKRDHPFRQPDRWLHMWNTFLHGPVLEPRKDVLFRQWQDPVLMPIDGPVRHSGLVEQQEPDRAKRFAFQLTRQPREAGMRDDIKEPGIGRVSLWPGPGRASRQPHASINASATSAETAPFTRRAPLAWNPSRSSNPTPSARACSPAARWRRTVPR